MLSVKEVCQTFGVTPMALVKWRRGSSRRRPLPVLQSNGRVTFEANQLHRWLADYRPDLLPLHPVARLAGV
jgi:hypothetical protein